MGVAAPPPAIPAHHRAFPGAGRIRHRPGHVQKRRVRARIGEPLRPGGVAPARRRNENGLAPLRKRHPLVAGKDHYD
ncbi:hypothetical protein CSC44_3155 [Pseudomonas aeruginosa]|nr:hypothetical protein CSC44_3155 [Pseudomonas aeruginosa]